MSLDTQYKDENDWIPERSNTPIQWSSLTQEPERLVNWLSAQSWEIQVRIPEGSIADGSFTELGKLLREFNIPITRVMRLNWSGNSQIEYWVCTLREWTGAAKNILQKWLCADPAVFIQSEQANIQNLRDNLKDPLTDWQKKELNRIVWQARKAWEILQKYPIEHPYPDYFLEKVNNALDTLDQVEKNEYLEKDLWDISHKLWEISTQIYGWLWWIYVKT